jgi:hypothetical protein
VADFEMDGHAESASRPVSLIIVYLLGLAIGVHLLNILALPTIAMIVLQAL